MFYWEFNMTYCAQITQKREPNEKLQFIRCLWGCMSMRRCILLWFVPHMNPVFAKLKINRDSELNSLINNHCFQGTVVLIQVVVLTLRSQPDLSLNTRQRQSSRRSLASKILVTPLWVIICQRKESFKTAEKY